MGTTDRWNLSWYSNKFVDSSLCTNEENIILQAEVNKNANVDKKLPVVIGVAILITILVYLALENSLLYPTLFSAPISGEEAVSIIAHQLNLTKDTTKYLSATYVYIKGDGSIFESDLKSNSIGKYIGSAEPTKTTGNYFAWEVRYHNSSYFIDSTTGEIISTSIPDS